MTENCWAEPNRGGVATDIATNEFDEVLGLIPGNENLY